MNSIAKKGKEIEVEGEMYKFGMEILRRCRFFICGYLYIALSMLFHIFIYILNENMRCATVE